MMPTAIVTHSEKTQRTTTMMTMMAMINVEEEEEEDEDLPVQVHVIDCTTELGNVGDLDTHVVGEYCSGVPEQSEFGYELIYGTSFESHV